jgi:2-polyprenyl-6-methoxyphenol hydroxylase-like FAD-dependent oxidoreductase
VDYDVAIVGARIAGSILAALLGARGHRVLLLDRTTFPSDTLSTHFFRAPSLRAFQQIGAYDEVEVSAPHLTVNYNVVDGIVFPEPVDRPEDYPFYMCVRRIALDEILVRCASRTPNVEVREGAKVDGVLWTEGRASGVTWKEPTGGGQALARVVVGADGLRSFVAREVGAEPEHVEPVNRAMYYAYFRGLEPAEGPAAEFHYRGDALVYCFPCDAGLTLVAASVPIREFGEFRRDPEGKLWNELNSMRALVPRLVRAERAGRVRGTGSIPGYLRIPYGEGWALVGDAGMVMDPWSGQGIDHACTHAVSLAGYLDAFLTDKQDWEKAMTAYHYNRNVVSQETYLRTCMYGADLRPMTRAALQRRGLI